MNSPIPLQDTPPLTPPTPNPLEGLYDRIRSQIEHEDELTHQRMTWLFSSQAVVFGLVGFFLTSIFKEISHIEEIIFSALLTVILWISSCMCRAAFISVTASLARVNELFYSWKYALKIYGARLRKKHFRILKPTQHWYDKLILLKYAPQLNELLVYGEPDETVLPGIMGRSRGIHLSFLPKILFLTNQIGFVISFVFLIIISFQTSSNQNTPTITNLAGTTKSQQINLNVAFQNSNLINAVLSDIINRNLQINVAMQSPITNTVVWASNAALQVSGKITNSLDERSNLHIYGHLTNTIDTIPEFKVKIDEPIKSSVYFTNDIKASLTGELKLIDGKTNVVSATTPIKRTTSGISILIGHQSETEGNAITKTNKQSKK